MSEGNNNFKRSFDSISYILNPIKYENDNKCFHELGLIGGPIPSEIKGNKTDLESELRGQTRKLGKCDTCRWDSTDEKIIIHSNENNKDRKVDTSLVNLEECQFVKYKPVPLPLGLELTDCPLPPRINK